MARSVWYVLCNVGERGLMNEVVNTILDTALVHNVVLVYFLGLCPFMGVSTRRADAWGMGLSTTVVLSVATVSTWVLDHGVLRPLGLENLRILGYILTIATLVQLLELVLRRLMPAVHRTLGVYLPLITTNCAVLGAALIHAQRDASFLVSATAGLGSGIGFTMVMVVFAGLRERLARSDVPAILGGKPIAFITAGILSLAVMGFSGLGG